MTFILDHVIYGIVEGNVMPNNISRMPYFIGHCTGNQNSSFACGGKNKYVKWDIALATTDFEIESEFKVDKVDSTGLVFVLWSGNIRFHIGLDGEGNTLFYEGDVWGGSQSLGKTNLIPNKFQRILLTRRANSLKVDLDGEKWPDLNFPVSINAIGWRPWQNTIHIKSLVIAASELNHGEYK